MELGIINTLIKEALSKLEILDLVARKRLEKTLENTKQET